MIIHIGEWVPYWLNSNDRANGIDYKNWIINQGGLILLDIVGDTPSLIIDISSEDFLVMKLKYENNFKIR